MTYVAIFIIGLILFALIFFLAEKLGSSLFYKVLYAVPVLRYVLIVVGLLVLGFAFTMLIPVIALTVLLVWLGWAYANDILLEQWHKGDALLLKWCGMDPAEFQPKKTNRS